MPSRIPPLGALYTGREECQYVAVATTTPIQPQRPLLRAIADATGLERVLWQRWSPGSARGIVAGTRRRRPAYVSVSARTAAALRDAGLPTVLVEDEAPR